MHYGVSPYVCSYVCFAAQFVLENKLHVEKT